MLNTSKISTYFYLNNYITYVGKIKKIWYNTEGLVYNEVDMEINKHMKKEEKRNLKCLIFHLIKE